MPLIRKTIEPAKPVEKWSNKDFLIYFSNRLAASTGKPLRIEGPAWQGFMARIKGFRSKLHLDAPAYKRFIDEVFDIFFKRPGYAPAFGAIVSERVYHIVTTHRKGPSHPQYSDFEKLREELYSNNQFFVRLLQSTS